jgi:hypothetical protein
MAAGGFGFADECPANPVARIFKGTANDSPSLYARSRAVEGRRSPKRWSVLRRGPNLAKRRGVRQSSGALEGRDEGGMVQTGNAGDDVLVSP